MATAADYLVKHDPYTGKNPRQQGLGLGSFVVKMLAISTVPKKAGNHVHVDVYFASLRLLREFTVDGIYCTGTVRRDRVKPASMKDLRKAQGGIHDVLQAANEAVRLVRWKDNSEVTVASNRDDPLVPGKTAVKRWSRFNKQKVDVPQPSIVNEYNHGMLRLDTLDLRTYWYVVNVPERGGSCGLCFESFWYRNPKERGGYGKGKDQQYKVYQSKQGIFSY